MGAHVSQIAGFFLFSFAFHSDYLAVCINDGSQVNCQPEIDFYSKFSNRNDQLKVMERLWLVVLH